MNWPPPVWLQWTERVLPGLSSGSVGLGERDRAVVGLVAAAFGDELAVEVDFDAFVAAGRMKVSALAGTFSRSNVLRSQISLVSQGVPTLPPCGS